MAVPAWTRDENGQVVVGSSSAGRPGGRRGAQAAFRPELPLVFRGPTEDGVLRAMAIDELDAGVPQPTKRPGGLDRYAGAGADGRWSVGAQRGSCEAPSPHRLGSVASSGSSSRRPAGKRRKEKDQRTLDGFLAPPQRSGKAKIVIDLTDSPPAAGPSRLVHPKPQTKGTDAIRTPSRTPFAPISSAGAKARASTQSTSQNGNPFQCDHLRTRLSPVVASPGGSPSTLSARTLHRRHGSRPSTPRGSTVVSLTSRQSAVGTMENPFQIDADRTYLPPPHLRVPTRALSDDESQDLSGSHSAIALRDSLRRSALLPPSRTSKSSASSTGSSSTSAPDRAFSTTATSGARFRYRLARDLVFKRTSVAKPPSVAEPTSVAVPAEQDWSELDRCSSPETEESDEADEAEATLIASTSLPVGVVEPAAPSEAPVRPPIVSDADLRKRYLAFRLLDPEWPQPKITICPSPSHPLPTLPALIASIVASGTSLPDGRKVVAFDMEWKPTYVAGRRESRTALIQISSLSQTLLIRLSEVHGWKEGRLPECVARDLLDEAKVVKVGVNVRGDGLKLARDFPHLCRTPGTSALRSYLDFNDLVWAVDPEKAERLRAGRSTMISLQRVVAGWLGKYMSKGSIRMSDWESRGKELTKKQTEYASIDVIASARVFSVLTQLAETSEPPVDCGSVALVKDV